MVFGFGRIEFDGNVIELNRPWSSFQPRRPVNSASVQAASGLEQTEFLFAQWFINARLNLLDPQEKAQLQRLFEYAEDGRSFTLIRDRNLGAYINFEGGINPTAAPRGLKTNDDVDGTFTRTNEADSAWYLDEGTGLMTLRDGEDVPRFPAGKYGAGIQIDGAAVNLIDQPSGPFNTNNWSSTAQMSFATDTAETKDPAGGNNADKLTATGTPGFTTNITGTAKGNAVTGIVWLKCRSGTVAARIIIGGSTSGTTEEQITVTPEWVPYVVTEADTSGWVGTLGFSIRIDTSGDIVYAWGAGLFDSFEFAPGTIGALSTSSITRNAEKLTFPSANIVNRDKGSILMWIKPRWASASGPAGVLFLNSGDSGGATADWHIVFYHTVANGLQLEANINNGATAAFAFSAAASLSQDTLHLIGGTWDATISNGHRLYLDGVLLDTSSNSPYNISETGDTFAIGSEIDGDQPCFCAIDEVLITRNVLTANEIAGIHALGIGLGVSRNRWTVKLNDQVWDPRWLGSDVYDIPLLLKEVLT